MGILVWALLLGFIPAIIAQSKGRSFAGWYVYGALLFIVAIVHAIVISPIEEPATDLRKCPFCAESIKAEATVCRFCQREVSPPTSSELSAPEKKKGGSGIVTLVLLVVLLIVLTQVYQPPMVNTARPSAQPDLSTFVAETLNGTAASQAAPTLASSVPSEARARITNYCSTLLPDSFSLQEVCVEQETLARNQIYSRVIDERIFASCDELVGESYSLLEVCITQEESARTRLNR